jgi:DNA-binding NarL/FixJ family response regulator
MRVRMLLADDHRLFIERLPRLLILRCAVKRTVTNGRELVSTATGLVADVVISNSSMPVLNDMALRMLPGTHRLDPIAQNRVRGVHTVFLIVSSSSFSSSFEGVLEGSKSYL